ncbi:MAG: hypothetical protein MI864_18005, partial [Pseudomonadales bacterium]|nr:hypothetical protein [Pseudomonadales bacterium]
MKTSLSLYHVTLVLTALLFSGCANLGYLADKFNLPAKVEYLVHEEQEYILASISTGLNSSQEPPKVIYFVGGSGCSSLALYMKRYFKGMPPGFLIY